MSVNTINFNNPISLADARKAIPIMGPHVTPIIKGEPGCGKSTLLKMLERDMGDGYDYIYVDCPLKDVGDTAMSVPDHARTKLLQVISDLFKLDSPKPKVIMLDEFMKTPKMLQIMWTRLTLERCLGDKPLPKDSIVFATSNNASDGVGDSMLAHAGNRVCIYNMRKPNATEWLAWASENGITAETRACIAMFPNMLASYLDGGQDDNPYIFNPARKTLSFVSPRSLALMDVAVRNRDKMGASLTQASIAGTVGAAAAEKLAAFLSLASELVSIKDVLGSPDAVRMPDKPAALFMMMFNAIDTIQTQSELASFMKFVNRISSSEVQSVFFTMTMQNNRMAKMAMHNEQIVKWARDNFQLMA